MKVALFDLDHTLLDGDSGIMWQNYLAEKGVVGEPTAHVARAKQFSDDYHAGILNYPSFLDFMLEPLVRFPLEDLHQWRADFVENWVKPVIKKRAVDLLDQHRSRGDVLVLISATNRFLTQPIADLLKIPNVISTDPEMIDGKYTGRITGTPCYQAGKITRFTDWASGRDHAITHTFFYSDSYNDVPLMATVSQPVAVDPDTRLRAFAVSQGWPVLELQ